MQFSLSFVLPLRGDVPHDLPTEPLSEPPNNLLGRLREVVRLILVQGFVQSAQGGGGAEDSGQTATSVD